MILLANISGGPPSAKLDYSLLLLADLNLLGLRLLHLDHEDAVRGQIGGDVLGLAARRHGVP